MPYSVNTLDRYVDNTVRELRPLRVLDIGAGAGKMANIVRERSIADSFNCHITGYEIFRIWITKYNLKWLYHDIINENILEIFKKPEVRYDLAMFGDSLEHFRKSDGIDIIHFLVYRCAYIMIITPERYIQDVAKGNIFEAHLSSWSSKDFSEFETVTISGIHEEGFKLNFFLIRGFAPSIKEIKREDIEK